MGLGLIFRINLIGSSILFLVLAVKLKKAWNMVVLLSLINLLLGAVFYMPHAPYLKIISPLACIDTTSIFSLIVPVLTISKNQLALTLNVKIKGIKMMGGC